MNSKLLRNISLFLCISFTFFSCEVELHAESNTWYEARVTAVIDGDTIQVQFTGEDCPSGCQWNERVRLVGVDTPELFTDPPEYYAAEARAYTNQIYRRDVLLVFDSISAKKDRYGRVLAYIYKSFDSPSINEQLILNGYGYYYDLFSFDPEKMNDFQNAEDYTRLNRVGLWR
ncbi:thermonuclease family protein [Treponema zuelzerae]|uniref:Thermonuclease family protein n=1 Tax=Teretinema zuelzerae TaxID=156 RepID=A0AAE3EFI0_9SPIR|nr:thermonuclease family protein [Teretinema zuelzerae]MCD1653537.1 thermonuclease family protein [Teretinema zuelzerae]